MKKLLTLLSVIALVAVFTLTGCSVSALGLNSSYNVFKETAGDETLVNYAVVSLEKENPLKEVWLVVSGLEDSTAKVGVYFASSESGFTKSYGSQQTVERAWLKKSDNVVKVPVDSSCKSRSYVQITVSDTMKISEIFVVDEKDKQVKATLVKAGVRILSDGILSDTDANVKTKEELEKSGESKKLGQYFAVLTNTRSVGVMGDGRTYDYTLALRAVTTTDFMTADFARIPYELLDRISGRIVNEVKGINRIVYDITSKPPATVEWE